MKKAIGGFFEMEEIGLNADPYHKLESLKLVNGRSALFVLLDYLKPRKVLLPFYSCDSLLQPILKLGIPFDYYSVDEGLLPQTGNFEESDFFIFINYFGLLEKELLAFAAEKNIKNFVVDNTQSFFSRPKDYYAFNSARKFFGVTDGAFLFLNSEPVSEKLSPSFFNNDFLRLRKDGNLQMSYALYKENELKQPCGMYQMSGDSDEILKRLNYSAIADKRKKNFIYLHNNLGSFNTFKFTLSPDTVPFAYPFVPVKQVQKQLLYDSGIFFPTLWEEVRAKNIIGFNWERKLSSYLIPLPIDHRYSLEDMDYIIKHILNQLK